MNTAAVSIISIWTFLIAGAHASSVVQDLVHFADSSSLTSQGIDADSHSAIAIDQEADSSEDGDYEQSAIAPSLAEALLDILQDVLGFNISGHAQLADSDGDVDQSAHIDLGAHGDGNQDLTGLALNATTVDQDASGDDDDGDYEQHGEIDSLAELFIGAVQAVSALNEIGLAQLAAGDGDVDQEAHIGADAHANADQAVVGIASNDTVLAQNAEGDGGDYEQDAELGSVAIGTVIAVQESEALNLVDLVQAGDAGEGCCTGDVDQEADLDLDATSDAAQAVIGVAGNSTVAVQNAEGDGGGDYEQEIGNTSFADLSLIGVQDVLSLNDVNVTQLGDGDDVEQDVTVDGDAAANADQAIIGTSNNDGVFVQNADGYGGGGGCGGCYGHGHGYGSDYEQTIWNIFNSFTLISAVQNITAVNILNLTQNCEGECEQTANVDMNADADASQSIVGLSGNTSTIIQDASGSGDGNYEQEAANDAEAAALLDAFQDVRSENLINIEQNAGGDDDTEQEVSVDADADADADQVVIGIADNTNTIVQNAEGDGDDIDQEAGCCSVAVAAILAGQRVMGVNTIDVAQDADGGEDIEQEVAIDADADADGSQLIVGVSSNDTLIVQDAEGDGDDGDVDQSAESDSAALTSMLGVQIADAVNDIDVAQSADGDGDGDYEQTGWMQADANANVNQLMDGGSINGTTIVQNGEGEDADQDAASESTALTEMLSDVTGVAANDIDLVQAAEGDGDDGDYEQDAALGVSADTDITSEQDGLSANETFIIQDASGGDDSDQSAWVVTDGGLGMLQSIFGASDNNVSAVQVADGEGSGDYEQSLGADVDADLDIEGTQDGANLNVVEVIQSHDGGDDGSTNQAAAIDAAAETFLGQDITGYALNDATFVQVAEGEGGDYEQDMAHEGDATVDIDGAQDGLSFNEIGVMQDSEIDDGTAAQDVNIDASALLLGDQTIEGVALNDGTFVQEAEGYGYGGGGSDYEQSMWSDNNAQTDIAADQDLVTGNIVSVDQESDMTGGAAAQSVGGSPAAIVVGSQDVTGLSINDSTMTQDAEGYGDGGGDYEQDMGNDSNATTDITADQDASALNNVEVTQRSSVDRGAVAQYVETNPVAITVADQNVDGSAINTNDMNQNAEGYGGGDYEQSAHNDADADTDIDANQEASAVNNVGVMQECDVTRGACAQYVEANPVAITDASQNVSGNAENNNTMNQNAEGEGDGDGDYEQDASNSGDADTNVNADQAASSGNDVEVFQTCTVNRGACAQYTEASPVSVTGAEQNISANSGNNATTNQNAEGYGGGDSEQSADSDLDSETTVDATQGADSHNDVTIVQEGNVDDGTGSQSAAVSPTATTESSQNISANSGNDSTINQNAEGDDGDYEQEAAGSGDSSTTVNSNQNAASGNSVGTYQGFNWSSFTW